MTTWRQLDVGFLTGAVHQIAREATHIILRCDGQIWIKFRVNVMKLQSN
jgi:hypothetical protein